MKKIKIISWNVNGIRAIYKKGFLEFFKKANPSIFCLQETKAQENQLGFELTQIDKYHSYFNSAQRKGYSGVVTYSKPQPKHISFGMNVPKFDLEGRIIQTDYDNFSLLNIYFPNGKRSKERLDYKMEFYQKFSKYIKKLLKTQKNIIVCGDINTAHKEVDLARPKDNQKISGFLPQERKWIDSFLGLGFIDSFRVFDKNPGKYTWWSMRTRARNRNVGWRIDYFLVSKNLRKNLKSAKILDQVMGSDHCPISIELEF
ncbi:MAG: exodeoxyribonuclease III [Patescibacteria group bacterium]